MIQELYDRHIFLYIMGGLCILGVFLKCFLLIVYNRLIDSSENMNSPKKNWMKNMKLRFEGAYELQLGVSDVDTYVDKYVSKVKYGGLLLSTWENISGQTIVLCLIVGSFSAVLGLVYKCGQDAILFTFFMGAWTAIIVNIVDNLVNISAHKQMLRYNLIDYFENNLKVRMEQEVFHSEDRKKYQREYFSDELHKDNDAHESTCFDHKALREVKTIAATKELMDRRAVKEEKRLEKEKKLRELSKDKDKRNSLEETEDFTFSSDHQEDSNIKLTRKQKKAAKKLEKEKAKQEKLDRKQEIADEKRRLKLEKKENKKLKKEEAREEKERKNRERIENKRRQKGKEEKEDLLKNNKAYKEKMRLLAEKQREAEKLREEESKKKEEFKNEEEIKKSPEINEEEVKIESVLSQEEKKPDIQVVKPQNKTNVTQSLVQDKKTTSESSKKLVVEREKRQAGDMTAISKEEDMLIEQVLQDFLSDKP